MVTEADKLLAEGHPTADLPIGTQIRELVTEASSLVATVRTLGEASRDWSLQNIVESASTLRTAVPGLEGKAADVGKWVAMLRDRATALETARRATVGPGAQALNKVLRG
ncbi:MAG: hypothetical protein GY772_23970, partial [bacterium]|nr:hypothetical protein [bacterium]